MHIFIDSRSGVPIYRQLIQQIENGILGGLLKPGQQLPTVREIALELTINPNTVARAYRELEQLGLLASYQGRGTFVSSSIAATDSKEKELIIKKGLNQLVKQAKQLNIHQDRLSELFGEVLNERGGEE